MHLAYALHFLHGFAALQCPCRSTGPASLVAAVLMAVGTSTGLTQLSVAVVVQLLMNR